jgi:CRISPR/Cas system-associated exonuclease Cas4 (RecB family)
MEAGYFLSPSSLNLFLECPRCFWLYLKRKISRPQGPVSTLPRGMDGLIKGYFDKYRRLGKLPPEIEGRVKAKLVEQPIIDKWRNWRIGLKYEQAGLTLGGALDECFMEDKIYIPVDYKTRGYPLKENSAGYYQNQLDIYALLLERNGFKTSGFAYLVFYILQSLSDNGQAKFDIQLIRLNTDAQRAYGIFRDAGELLKQDSPPKRSAKCAFCSWAAMNTNER